MAIAKKKADVADMMKAFSADDDEDKPHGKSLMAPASKFIAEATTKVAAKAAKDMDQNQFMPQQHYPDVSAWMAMESSKKAVLKQLQLPDFTDYYSGWWRNVIGWLLHSFRTAHPGEVYRFCYSFGSQAAIICINNYEQGG